jgi:serine/threonine protein kinase
MSEYASGSDPGTPAGSGGRSPSFVARGQLPTSASGRQAFPKQLSEKYRLGEELGRGAYGRVYRGLDARTGEQVAIKQISFTRIPTGALASLVTEVELLKALNHCNVVQYLGSFRTRTDLYIIMELVENGSLAAVIKAQQFGPFPEALVGMFIHQVLQGLAYLHDQGVVHRDIKGANILTTKDGVVKLADFGVAARLGDGTTGATNGEDSANNAGGEETEPAGTPYWMAPEVVELKTVTTASDIWSVGCLAVELLTGQPPYYDLQPLSALYNIVQNPHPPLPTTASPSMLDFLLQCFRKVRRVFLFFF